MVTPPLSPKDIVREALDDVLVPAMQKHIDQALQERFGDKWLAHILEDKSFVKTLKDAERDTLEHLPQHVAKGEAKPADRFEPTHFPTLVRLYKDAFPPRLYTHRRSLEAVRDSRNFIKHQSYLSEQVTAQAILSNYRAVLDYIEDHDAVNAIEKLQNQLNDLDSEDAPNLAEQDGEPPARQAEGGGLRRGWFYVFGAGVLIIAVIAAALGSRSGNVAPVCSDIGDVELTGPSGSDGAVTLGDYCTDDDDGDLTFSAASSDNSIVSAAVAGDSLILTAGDGSGGTAKITVTATDPDEQEAIAEFDVTVNPSPQPEKENQPPDCVKAAGVTIVEGGEREVSISCSDPDGDTIMLRVSADSQTDHHSISPDAARIDGSGARPFTITGLSSSVGTNYVEIEADDGKGGTDRVRFGVVVEDDEGETEDEPSLGVPPKIEGGISCTPSPVATNASVECRVSVSGTAPLTYEWRGGSPSNTAGASYNVSFNSEGSQSVLLTVSNAAGSDDGTTTVQVMTPPTISSLGCPSSATVNQAVSCSPTVSGTGPFTYSWSGGDSPSFSSSESYSSSWSTVGTKTVSLSVNNEVGDDNETITVTVVEPPAIDSISCTPSPAATNASVNCSVDLSGGTPPFTYEWRGGSSSNEAGTSYNASFSSEGSHSVSLTVSNAAGSDDDSVTVRVMAPPMISSLGCPSLATENRAVTCSPSVSGTEPLKYTWSGGDSGGSSASYSPRWNAAGAKMVWLSVRNEVGDDSRATNVHVNGAPHCRDVANVFRIEIDYFSILDLRGLCTDPEGDPLSYTIGSYNHSVATVSVRDDGVFVIDGHSGGETMIQITVEDGHGGFAVVGTVVHVEVPVFGPPPPPTCEIEDRNLVESDHEEIYLDAHCHDRWGGAWGDGRLTDGRLTFEAESSNNSVVSLDGPLDDWRGLLLINANGAGRATITVRVANSDGVTGWETFIVTVAGDVTCILDPSDDEIWTSLTGDPTTYTYTLRCEDSASAQLAYTLLSDDSNVADASYDGETLTISIRGRGTTTIHFTATAPDGQSWRGDFVVRVIS